MKRHIFYIFFGKGHMEKSHLRNVSLQSLKFSEIGGKCFIVSGGWTPLPYGIVSPVHRRYSDPSLWSSFFCTSQWLTSTIEVSFVIDAWLSSDRLLLNPDTTQFMLLGVRLQLDKIYTASLHLIMFSHIQYYSPLLLVTWELSWIQSLLSLTRSTPFPDPAPIIFTSVFPFAGHCFCML